LRRKEKVISKKEGEKRWRGEEAEQVDGRRKQKADGKTMYLKKKTYFLKEKRAETEELDNQRKDNEEYLLCAPYLTPPAILSGPYLFSIPSPIDPKKLHNVNHDNDRNASTVINIPPRILPQRPGGRR